MPGAESRATTAWGPIRRGGRSFLRATLPPPWPGASPCPFDVPQPIAGRYRVDDLLAVGGASVVLLANDLRTRHPVAVKALRADAILVDPDDPDPAPAAAREVRRARHLLQTERRLLTRLRNAGSAVVPHPNDYVYDLNPAREGPGVDAKAAATEPYLVLELVAGVPLDAWLAREARDGMDEGEALAMLAPVVETLAILHEPWEAPGGRTWQVVYQDLKPANILVGPSGRPRLIDLAGCQVVVDGVPVLEGSFTPGYAPPECLGGGGRVLSPGADVFTIGVTLHQMLTGLDPQDPRSRPRGRGGPIPDPRALPPRVSTRTRAVLARCLAPRPSDRPADARRVALALFGPDGAAS